jgi:hypothetical protein
MIQKDLYTFSGWGLHRWVFSDFRAARRLQRTGNQPPFWHIERWAETMKLTCCPFPKTVPAPPGEIWETSEVRCSEDKQESESVHELR